MHENFATAFDQLWKIVLDEENWISLKWPRLACETRHTIGNEEFRFTSPIDEQEDFPGSGWPVACSGSSIAVFGQAVLSGDHMASPLHRA